MRSAALAPLLSLPVFGALAAFSPPAAACGESPTPFVSLDAILPTAGAVDVSPDSVIAVAAQGTYGGTPAESSHLYRQSVRFEVRARGADAASLVPGEVASWIDAAVFVPAAPLAPNTVYDVMASVSNRADAGKGDTGPTTSFGSFTTGSTRLEPLGFGGVPSFAFEDRDHEVCVEGSGNDCGGCARTGLRSDRTVIIDLPAPNGGDGIRGFAYRARANLVRPDDEGGFVPQASFVPSRSASQLLIPLFAAETPYGICVDIELFDARGTVVSSKGTCFAKETVWKASAPITGGAGSATAGPDESGAPSTDPGCALSGRGAAPASRGGGFLLIAGALAALLGGRRARSSGSPRC